MMRKVLLGVLFVTAVFAWEIITAPDQHQRHAAHFSHTIDRCWQIMASKDQSEDVQRAKDFCTSRLRSIERSARRS
jgi:hypothetical protein